ncbi:aldo/keto reductase [Neorhizobium sp. Rsf11]|uniref:Aldo/keto reductase n=2 Tax=Neorhizobium TaxID=1525371 RepID=A0ABV0MBR2_9HYPH|nr:aldo/keto reductase [Neorhizobium petrolearium]MCC2614593.1 aldo/keto reductase [Neorhizobium petrolearium]WGI72349.1 aldo/keto reductase [Neorhizobium petrolearium]
MILHFRVGSAELVRNNSFLPKVGLGTWGMRDELCVIAVRNALEMGYRFVDTASFYGNEREVGKGISQSGVCRDEITISTKIWHTDFAPEAMKLSVETSLEKLQVDYIDLLLLHWPPRDLQLAPPLNTLASFVDAGLAKTIGVSNFPQPLLETAVEVTSVPLACNQVEMHIGLRDESLLKVMRDKGIALVAHCPLARGVYSEHPALRAVAAKHKCSWQQVALAWLVMQDNVHAIPGADIPAHQWENLLSTTLMLDEEDRVALEAVQDGRRVSTSPYPVPGMY